MGKSTKDNRDVYYRSAKQEGYRARSAFKLLNLNKSTDGKLFRNVKRAVDLCAAPGSWSQVLSQEIYLPNPKDPSVKIVAVDFQFMVPIPGVTQLQGDITQMTTVQRILTELGNEKADLIVCDGAPDVTGLHELDKYRQKNIVLAALALTTAVLKYGGTLVVKVFKRKQEDLLHQQLSSFFRNVTFEKPEASRDSSLEHFALCTDHFCPDGYEPRMLLDYLSSGDLGPCLNTLIPFVVYGEMESAPCTSQQSSSTENSPAHNDSDCLSAQHLKKQSGTREKEEPSTAVICALSADGDSAQKTSDTMHSRQLMWKSCVPTVKELLSSWND